MASSTSSPVPDPFDWALMSHVASPDDWDAQGPMTSLRYDQFWSGFDNPEKIRKPAEIEAAEKAGEYDKSDALYAEHYKKKIFGDE